MMKIRILTYTIAIFLIIILQTTILNEIRILDVKPNLLIVFVVSAALIRGNVEGAAAGFFAGLAQDMATGRVIGFYALLGLYLGLIIGSVNKRLYRENYLVVIFFTFISSIAYEAAVFFLSTILPLLLSSHSAGIDLLSPLMGVILPEAVYNSLVSIFIYSLVIRLNRRFEDITKAARKY